jgi:hypothetical protein
MDNLIQWLPFMGCILVMAGTYLLGKRKDSADISDKLADATNKLTELYDKRINALEKTVKEQDEELKTLRPLTRQMREMTKGVNILVAQLRRQGHEPEWTPAQMALAE